MATVLLVEDDPAARHGLELALRRLGYGVRAAARPTEKHASEHGASRGTNRTQNNDRK